MGTVVEFKPATSDASASAEAPVKRITMDDGHTRIAHGLLEELMQVKKYKLSGREYAVLMVVLRKTYGYMKSEDWIALSQFELMTGIEKSNCRKVILSLVDRKILNRSVNGNDQKLSININVNDWLLESPSKQAAAKKKQAKNGIWSNSTISESNSTISESNSTISESNSTNTIDKYNNNTLKDNVPTVVETAQPDQPKKKTRSLKFSPEDRQFAEYMAQRIDAVNGLTDKRRNLDSWANQIRMIREIDDRNPEDIAQVFQWAIQDHFWQSNIQSPEKLRKQFIRLYGESRKANHFGASNHENHNSAGQQHRSQQEYIDDISWLDD
ncbi:replication protein [Endozoicomonas ascidiicola]|uniref:replication protein n=1 Tax=Endozoicomonas ascidiicola TaxID=1698521 RepID=UPI000831F5EA|nr:replication protein [Endozoicomonas ascidiicola]